MYSIIRFYTEHYLDRRVIEEGCTLEYVQEHCNREDTHGDGWFDGYEKENEDE